MIMSYHTQWVFFLVVVFWQYGQGLHLFDRLQQFPLQQRMRSRSSFLPSRSIFPAAAVAAFGGSRRHALHMSSSSTTSTTTATTTTATATTSSTPHVKEVNGVYTVSIEVGGKVLSFETGKIGRQANGAVVARQADTMVYSTVCFQHDSLPTDFTPLRVDYFARYSAVGQTIGAFHRRDSRGDDTEILIARLIDRPIRPMIRDGWQHDTQILAWLLSYDKQHSPEALAICAASAALAISEVPTTHPIAGVVVGLVNNELIINPTNEELNNSTLQLTLAGTKTGILMIEGTAEFVTEEQMMAALTAGSQAIAAICSAIEALQQAIGKPKRFDSLHLLPPTLVDEMDEVFGEQILKALSVSEKSNRGEIVAGIEKEIALHFSVPTIISPKIAAGETTGVDPVEEGMVVLRGEEDDPTIYLLEDDDENKVLKKDLIDEDEASEIVSSLSSSTHQKSTAKTTAATTAAVATVNAPYDPLDIKIATKKLLVRKLRQLVLTTGKRTDGRSTEDVRPISIETDLLPGAHGSALFTRGETQSLSTATLGSKSMEAKYETVDEVGSKRFYLQYRFPPSSVGEVGRVGGLGRREVGHGNLAERALLPALPSIDTFPYSIRAESLITESSGSSSMATVCGCCLAMLDAGVPLATPIAGVAMGLILGEKQGDSPVILTDILGLEDALGTMDFKVAGNATGITTFQLDIKCDGLTLDTLQEALEQAKRGRLHILEKMQEALPTARSLKPSIPRLLSFMIPPEAIGRVIGPKGKTITTLIETYKVKDIVLEDDGLVQIESFSEEQNQACKEAILKLATEAMEGSNTGKGKNKEEKAPPTGPPPEAGIIYRDCVITGVHNFGVFVEILPGYEGLVHVSELDIKRIPSPDQGGFTVGQRIDVKCLGKNEKGQTRLSRRMVILRDSNPSGENTAETPTAVTTSTAATALTTSTPSAAPITSSSSSPPTKTTTITPPAPPVAPSSPPAPPVAPSSPPTTTTMITPPASPTPVRQTRSPKSDKKSS